jgi:hypothetical protein
MNWIFRTFLAGVAVVLVAVSCYFFWASRQEEAPTVLGGAGTTTFVTSTQIGFNYLGGTLTKPTNVADGDLIVIYVWYADGSDRSAYALSGLTGFTEIQNAHAKASASYIGWRVYYKVASSEPSSWTITTSGGSTATSWDLTMVVYRDGFSITDPIDDSVAAMSTANDTSVATAGVTCDAANETILFAGQVGTSRTFTPPSNPGVFTEDIDKGGANGQREAAHYNWSSSGATGAITATISGNSIYKGGSAICLNPYTEPVVSTNRANLITFDED